MPPNQPRVRWVSRCAQLHRVRVCPVCVCVCVCAYVFMYAHDYVYVYVCMHGYVHTNVYV